MTKEQVINFIKSELECGNSILIATLGNGGAGESLVSDVVFSEYLKILDFAGMVKPSADIAESEYYVPAWHTYQFNEGIDFSLQLQAE